MLNDLAQLSEKNCIPCLIIPYIYNNTVEHQNEEIHRKPLQRFKIANL